MSNGQMNIVSVPAATQSLTLEAAVQVAAAMDSVLQNGGDFAGLLSGLQLQTKGRDLPDSVEVKTLQGNLPPVPVAAAEDPAIDLLAQLTASSRIQPASETDVQKPEDAERTDLSADAVQQGSNLPDVTAQIVLAAYSQPGRMPEVTMPAALPVDRRQNGAEAAVYPVAPAVKIQAEQVSAAPAPAEKPAAAVTKEPAAPTPADLMQQQPETVRATAVDRQPVTTVAATPVSAPMAAQAVAPAAQAVAAPPAAPGVVQPLPSDRMPEVNKPSASPVDRLQDEATAAERPAVITAPAVKMQAEHNSAAPAVVSAQKPAVAPAKGSAAPTAAEQNQHQQSETIRTAAVDREPAATFSAAPTVAAHIPTPAPASIEAAAAPRAVQPVLSGRVPEVNKPPASPVDRLQNAATATEHPAVITAPAVTIHAEHASVAEAHLSAEKPDTAPDSEPAVPAAAEPIRHQQPASVQTAAVNREPAAIVVPAAATAILSAAPPASIVAPAASPVPRVVQPVPSGRMSEVNKPAAFPVDRQQHEVTATGHPAVITAPDAQRYPEQAAAEPTPASSPEQSEPQASLSSARPAAVQHHQDDTVGSTVVNRQPVTTAAAEAAPHAEVVQPVRQDFAGESVPSSPQPGRMPDVNKPTPPPVDRLQNGAAITEQPAVSLTPESEPPISHRQAAAAGASAESEIEILLSQPQPITARASVATVAADSRPASLVQDIRAARQQRHPESQTDKIRTGNEQSVVKEMTSILQAVGSSGESIVDSGTSRGSDSNQGQPDDAPDNPVPEQGARGQIGAEQQKLSASAPRIISTEPARQEIPEQIVHQVKERLVQHEVKAGNQQITLTLSPDSLGELKMNLNLQGQKLSVEIVTENRTVRDAIVLHADALKESLARQNITMESFDVTTGGKGSGSQGQNPNSWRELVKQQQEQQHSWASPRVYHSAQADIPSGHGAYQRSQGQSMLDIHY